MTRVMTKLWRIFEIVAYRFFDGLLRHKTEIIYVSAMTSLNYALLLHVLYQYT